MGNIIAPSPGDLVDRQTILQTKIARCGIESDTGNPQTSQIYVDDNYQLPRGKDVVGRTILDKESMSKIDIQPFMLEHEAIQQRLELDWFPKLSVKQVTEGVYDKLLEELRAVNEQLWNLEDQARTLRSAPNRIFSDEVSRRAAQCLFEITRLNDKRADLVKQVNALWGIAVQEKVYA